LDFERVTLIGILNADNLLNAPDFRAGERAWQTIVQMAGRCGRRDGRGEVIIQSADPCHSLLAIASENLYEKMATTLLAERQRFSYPPYTRLIRITLRDTDTQRLATVASSLGSALRERFASRVFGPVTPLLDRMRGEYIVEIMLKIEVEASFARAKQILRECIDVLRREPELRKTTIICDVDFV
jgi:primosomal protein N' (replication factor Y)